MRALFVLASHVVALLVACTSEAPDPGRDDVPTKGDIVVVADPDLERIIESERYLFESIYPDAKVRVRYLPDKELREAMRNDSVRVVFTTCLPGEEEMAFFRTRNLFPANVPILTDGIAVVKARGGQPDTLSLEALRGALTDAARPKVLFDGPGTGIARTVVDSLFGGDASMLTNASAVDGLDSLVARLNAVPGSIGLIAFAHLSDLDDAACRALQQKVTLCAISPVGGGRAVLPNQSNLKDGRYPLCRKLYAVLKEGKTGLGTGFVSFVAGHKGQRIILKSGLAPQTIPGRDVELVTN